MNSNQTTDRSTVGMKVLPYYGLELSYWKYTGRKLANNYLLFYLHNSIMETSIIIHFLKVFILLYFKAGLNQLYFLVQY